MEVLYCGDEYWCEGGVVGEYFVVYGYGVDVCGCDVRGYVCVYLCVWVWCFWGERWDFVVCYGDDYLDLCVCECF